MMLTVPKATVVVTTVPLTKAVVRQLRFVKNYEQSRELAKGKFEVLGHLAGHVVDSELDYLEVWLVALEKETIVVARHAAEIFLGMDSFVAVDKWPRIVVG